MSSHRPIDSFSTLRLTAEKLCEDHLDDLVRLHLDPAVSRYLGGVRSPETTKAYLAANIAHWDQHGFGLWILRTRDGAFAGRAGIRHILVGDTSEVEVAYTFEQTFWGRGLASEITEALVDLGFGPLGLPSLVGVVAAEHGASRHVLEKSRFAFERWLEFQGEPCALYRRPRPGLSAPGAA